MIQTVVNQVIPRIEEALPHLDGEDTQVVVEIRNFYCGLHNLVHMAEVMSSAANDAEIAEFDGNPPKSPDSFPKSAKEASAVPLVRKACKVFAAGGDAKSGCHGKAAIFLAPVLKEFGVKSIPLTQFHGHRFNILAFNSEYVYCLWEPMAEFLRLNHENGLTASLLFDLNVKFNRRVTRAFAIMSKLYASPLARMLEDKEVDVVRMGRAYAELVSALESASETPQELLEG